MYATISFPANTTSARRVRGLISRARIRRKRPKIINTIYISVYPRGPRIFAQYAFIHLSLYGQRTETSLLQTYIDRFVGTRPAAIRYAGGVYNFVDNFPPLGAGIDHVLRGISLIGIRRFVFGHCPRNSFPECRDYVRRNARSSTFYTAANDIGATTS